MYHSLFRSSLSIVVALATVFSVMVPTASAQSSRPWVGIVLGESDPRPGVDVDIVLRRSPAYEAGLQDGDRVLAVNARPVRTRGKLESILREQRPGRTVVITVQRGGATETVEVSVEVAPSTAEVLDGHHRGFAVPDVELIDLEGQQLTLTDDQPGLIVVEFWATWCSVCRQVSRKLEAALDDHPQAFTVISVTSEDADTVRDHLQTHPKAHRIALDADNRAHDAFLVNSYPFVVAIDAAGTIMAVVTGVGEIDDLISNLVGDQAPGDEPQQGPQDGQESGEPSSGESSD